MPAQKDRNPQERQKRGLTHDQADQGWGKGKPEPVKVVARIAMHPAHQQHGKDEAGQKQKGPENSRQPQAKKAHRVGKRQRPGRVAHQQNGAGSKACIVLDAGNRFPVIRVLMVDELLPRGPVGNEIAGHGDIARKRDDAEKKDRKSERQAAGHGNGQIRQICGGSPGGVIWLTFHAGYCTGVSSAIRVTLVMPAAEVNATFNARVYAPSHSGPNVNTCVQGGRSSF